MTLLIQNLGFKLPVCANLWITCYCKIVYIHLRNRVQPNTLEIRNKTSRVYLWHAEKKCFFDATKIYVENSNGPSREPVKEGPKELFADIIQPPAPKVAAPPRHKWTKFPSPKLEILEICEDAGDVGTCGAVTRITKSQLGILKSVQGLGLWKDQFDKYHYVFPKRDLDYVLCDPEGFKRKLERESEEYQRKLAYAAWEKRGVNTPFVWDENKQQTGSPLLILQR